MLTFWLEVILPVVLGSLILALVFLARRAVMKSGRFSPLQFLILSFGTITFLSGLFYVARWGFTVPKLLPGFWIAVFGSTVANVAIQYLNTRASAIPEGEVSLTAPLQAMTPGLIWIMAITLGEFPGLTGVAGIFLMAAGSYVLTLPKNCTSWHHYFLPIRRIGLIFRSSNSQDAKERGRALVIKLSLLSAMMGTIGLLFDGLYTRRGVDLQGLTLGITALVGGLTLTNLVWYLAKPDATTEQRSQFRSSLSIKTISLIALFAGGWTIAVLMINPTYHEAYVAYVGALKRFHILFTVILGYLIFREEDFKKRLGASALIVAGAVLISMDGLPERITASFDHLGI